MHIVLVLTLTKEIQKDISHSTFWKRRLLDNHLLMPRLGALRKILKYKTFFHTFTNILLPGKQKSLDF